MLLGFCLFVFLCIWWNSCPVTPWKRVSEFLHFLCSCMERTFDLSFFQTSSRNSAQDVRETRCFSLESPGLLKYVNRKRFFQEPQFWTKPLSLLFVRWGQRWLFLFFSFVQCVYAQPLFCLNLRKEQKSRMTHSAEFASCRELSNPNSQVTPLQAFLVEVQSPINVPLNTLSVSRVW